MAKKQSIICKRLKELRVEAGLSQKKLGILAGIDEFAASARMNQYEKGVHTPDYSTIQRFAKVMKVPTCYFYAEDNNMAEMIRAFDTQSVSDQIKIIKNLRN